MTAKRRLLAGSMAFSAALHSLLFMPWHVLHSHAEPPELMELDLAGPPGPSGAPAARAPRAAAAPAAEWKIPGAASRPETPVPAAPDPGDADAPSDGPPGAGGAGGGGSGRGTVKPPVLLNHGELHRLLQKLYPDSERELGREGMVVLSLVIGTDGRASSAEVVRSAGPAFDAAAVSLSGQLRYAPAEDAGRPLEVRMRQAVLFKLER